MAEEFTLPEADEDDDVVLAEAGAVLRRQPILVALALVAALVSTEVPVVTLEGAVEVSVVRVATVPVWIATWTLVGGLAAAFVAQRRQRGATSLRDGVATIGRRAGTVLAVGLVYAVAVVVGLLCLVLPGIVLALRLSFSVPICVVEGCGVRESLAASWERTREPLRQLAVLGGFVFGVGLFLSIQSGTMLSAAEVRDPFVVDLLGSLFFSGAALVWNLAVAVVYAEARDAAADGGDGAGAVAEPSGGDRAAEPSDREDTAAS